MLSKKKESSQEIAQTEEVKSKWQLPVNGLLNKPEMMAVEAITEGVNHALDNGQTTATVAVTERVTKESLKTFLPDLLKMKPPIKGEFGGKPESDPPREFLVLTW